MDRYKHPGGMVTRPHNASQFTLLVSAYYDLRYFMYVKFVALTIHSYMACMHVVPWYHGHVLDFSDRRVQDGTAEWW